MKVITVNIGTIGSTLLFKVDIEADAIAEAGSMSLDEIRKVRDRDQAMKIMSKGVPIIINSLCEKGAFDGVIGMDSGGGTA